MKHTAERQLPFGDAGPQEERVPSSRPREELVVDWTDDAPVEDTDRFVDWTDDAGDGLDGLDEDDAPDTDRSGVHPRLELPWQPASDPGELEFVGERARDPDAYAPEESRPTAPPGWPTAEAAPRPAQPAYQQPGYPEPGYPAPAYDDEPAPRPTWPSGLPSLATELAGSVARPLATHAADHVGGEALDDLPADLFGYPSADEEPVTWVFDPAIERAWIARRGRRIAVRAIGWMLVALSVAGVVRLAATDAVAAEMGYFASMGQIDADSQAGRVVRANARIAHAPSYASPDY